VFYAIYAGSALGGFSTNASFPLKTYQTYAFRKAKIPSISSTSVQSTAATSWTLPSITTADNDSFVFFAIGNDRDANSTASVSGYTNSNLANITELHDETTSTGLGGGIATVYAEEATPSSIGTTSATSAASNTAAFITFAISPAIITADGSTFSYTGGAANLYNNKLVTADTGTFSYTGNDASLLYNRVFSADSGIYSYTGIDAALTYTPAGSYTITAGSGSFSYTSPDVNLITGFALTADNGSYSYSGEAATFAVGKILVADGGSFSYTGSDASLASGRKITADAVTYSYSGTAADLSRGYVVTADAGSYAYTGTAASLNYGRKLTADAGSFSYSGGAATLTFESGITKIWLGSGKISNLKIGSFQIYEAYLGSAQVWGRSRPANAIVAETRSFTYTGSDATMFRGRKMAANGASYAITGTANTLKVGRKLVADAASYTLTGTAATLSNAYTWTRYATIYDDSGNGSSSITAVFNTNGTITFNTSLGDGASLDTDFTHWHDGGTVTGIGNSRWAKKTSSGDPTTGTLTTSLVALSSSKTISISTVGGEGRSGVELVEIYSDSGGTTKVGQITLTITATL
jgi:hypothetical protein